MFNEEEYLSALKEDYVPHIRTAIGVAGLLLTIFKVGTATYNLYYSKAAKACKGKKVINREKANCIIKYKREALTKQIQSITSNLNRCSKTKDSKRCTDEIKAKVLKLQKKRKSI